MTLSLLGFLLNACAPAAPEGTAPPTELARPVPDGPVPFALPSGPAAITPSFARDGGDLLYVWQEPEGGQASEKPVWRVRFARMHAGSWSTPVDLARGTDILANWADFPAVGVAPDGTLAAHWFKATSDAYEFQMARSADSGATWTSLPAPYPAGLPGERGFVSYATTADGLTAYWLDGRGVTGGHEGGHGGATALRSARLGPDGFLPDEVVDTRTCDCCGTDAVVAAGRSVVVYRDRDEGERRDISAAVRDAYGGTAEVPLGADGWVIHGCPVNGPALDSAADHIVAAWFTAAEDRQAVRASFSTDGGATFGSAVTVVDPATDARPLGRVDVLHEPDGAALVTWLSAEGEDGKVRIRRVARDGRVGPSVELGASTTARASGFPRLVRHEGRVIAAWTTPQGGNTAVSFEPTSVPAVERALGARSPDARDAVLPTFEARDLSGATVSRETVRGTPVLLNVWATWCGPCREELPALAELQRAYPGVKVLALSVDGAGAAPAVARMVEARAPGLTVLHPDTAGLAAQLGVSALPRTFLYDASGNLSWSSTGAIRVDDPGLVEALSRLASHAGAR